MNQMNLFDANTMPPPPPSPYPPSATGSFSGNRWHEVCESRLQQYGFRRLASRYQLAGALEFDGYFKTNAGLHVLAEYKERIDQRIFKELVGQARIGQMLNHSHRMAIVILTGFIDPSILHKEYMLNAASDDIYLIGNPHHPTTESFLRSLASIAPDKLYSITYNNLSRRIAKHGGFAAYFTPEYLQ